MRTTLRHAIAAALFVVAGVAGPGYVRAQDPSFKPGWLVEAAQKASFTDEDRRIAADFLAEHGELRSAPPPLAIRLRRTNQWSTALDPYTVRVPRRLDQSLSPLPEGFVRRIFDRSLWLVSADTGEVVDRIDPER